MDLTTEICGIKLKNPTMLASGILGVTGASMLNVIKHGAGAAVTKSIGLEERTGHPAPVVLSFGQGLINAVGLSNAGVKAVAEEIKYYKNNTDTPLIASIFAPTADEFGKIAAEISLAKPDIIEVNISCPNVESEFGQPFGTDPEAAGQVTAIVKANTDIPVMVKLSPNVTDITRIARAVEATGADAISAINTLGPGMVIDIKTGKPVLDNKVGGVSGPAIKPIAVRCVYQIYQNVKIPVVGIGGVTTWQDAIEMIMAGARAVQIGSAVYFEGVGVFEKITAGIEKFMREEGYSSVEEMVGKVHQS